MASRPRDGWLIWLILFAAACLIWVIFLQWPAKAETRAQQHWGGFFTLPPK